MKKTNQEEGFYFSKASQASYEKHKTGSTVYRKPRRVKHNSKKNRTLQDDESVSRFISEGSPDVEEKVEHPLGLIPPEDDGMSGQEKL